MGRQETEIGPKVAEVLRTSEVRSDSQFLLGLAVWWTVCLIDKQAVGEGRALTAKLTDEQKIAWLKACTTTDEGSEKLSQVEIAIPLCQFKEAFGDFIWDSSKRSDKRLVEVLRLRTNQTLDEVGDQLSVTRERVRQMEWKAEKRLRNSLYALVMTREGKGRSLLVVIADELASKAEESGITGVDMPVVRKIVDVVSRDEARRSGVWIEKPETGLFRLTPSDFGSDDVRAINCLERVMREKGYRAVVLNETTMRMLEARDIQTGRHMGRESPKDIIFMLKKHFSYSSLIGDLEKYLELRH